MREMWRVDVTGTEAGAPPGCGCEYFDVIDVAGCDKPARPPALQERSSRVWADRIIIAGTIGGPAALHDHHQARCGLDGLHVGH
jgi:hypothetical protein